MKRTLEQSEHNISDYYELDFQRGELSLRQVHGRSLLLPTSAWVALRKELVRTFKEGAVELMFQIGYVIGLTFMERFKKPGSDAETIMASLPEIGALSGWGSFSLVGDVNRGTELILRATNCPFCAKKAPDDPPLCDFLAGVFNGMVDGVYGGNHEGRETRCESSQGGICEIVVREVSEKPDERRNWGTYLMFPWLSSKRR